MGYKITMLLFFLKKNLKEKYQISLHYFPTSNYRKKIKPYTVCEIFFYINSHEKIKKKKKVQIRVKK